MCKYAFAAITLILAGCNSTGGSSNLPDTSPVDPLETALTAASTNNPCASKAGADANTCRTEIAKDLLMLADQQFYAAAKQYHAKAGFWQNLWTPETVTKLVGAGLAAGTLYYSIGGDSTTTDPDGNVVPNTRVEDKRRNLSVATGFLLAFQAIFGFDDDGVDAESVVNSAELARRDVRDGIIAKLNLSATDYSVADVVRDIARYSYVGDLTVAKERS